MSYPPPLPSSDASSSPPPVPLPVQSLEYTSADRSGRPGVLTAVGVISISVAAISFLFSAYVALSSAGLLFASMMPPAAFVPPPPPPMPRVTATASRSTSVSVTGGMMTDADADGIAQPQRQVVLAAMQRQRGLSLQRTRQLDALLEQAGGKMFPPPPPQQQGVGISDAAKAVRDSITESGVLPGVGVGGSGSGRGSRGPNYWVISTGRVEVYDDHAVFRPDGSADVVSVSVTDSDANDPTASSSSSPPGSNVATGGTFSSSSSRVTINARAGTGGVSVTTSRGGAVGAAGGGGPAVAANPAFRSPFAGISPVAASVTAGAALLSMALAVYLLVIGILVLRDSPRGAALHWAYVWIKLPLVVVSGVAGWILWTGMMSGMMSVATAGVGGVAGGPPVPAATATASVTTMNFGLAVSIGIGSLLAAAYPVALIFVLRSRAVREFYSGVRSPAPPQGAAASFAYF